MAGPLPYSFHTFLLSSVAVIWSFGSSIDLMLFCILGIIRHWGAFQEFFDLYINPATVIDLVKPGACLFVFLRIYRYCLALLQESTETDEFPVKPMFFPSRTSHTRLFPKKHSFSYSYLMVGIPVGWKGSLGGMLSVDDEKGNSPWYFRLFSLGLGNAWYVVNGDDYLDRGHVDGGLKGKLEQYLQSQGVDPSEFPHAYLLTAPRFLNYSSNPVSIWSLYSATKELSAVILEVNNTFDERHIYFLRSSPTSSPPNPSESSKFTHSWPKSFYVSPLNSRSGTYSLLSHDPFAPLLNGPGLVNTTITLTSSQNHPKLIARIFSTSPPLDPASLSILQKTRFLASWWWVGLATFPRTLKEAALLVFERGLPWVFRPEPMRDTISRHADSTEILIAGIFRGWLVHVVENAGCAVRVKYMEAGIPGGGEEVMMSSGAQLEGKVGELVIRVLTPAFYSRFTHYTSILEAFQAEMAMETVCVDGFDILSVLVAASNNMPRSPMSIAERFKYALIDTLRTPPPPTSSHTTEHSSLNTTFKSPTLTSGHSEFDHFVQTHAEIPPHQRHEYTNRVLKMLISEYVALSWEEILDLEIFACRCLGIWVLVGWLGRWPTGWGGR